VSTNYVFDGTGDTPWTEEDLPRPRSVYGLSKLAGEYLVRGALANHLVIRTCGLYGVWGTGGKGGNFVETMLRVGVEQPEVIVVNDQVASPTYTRHLGQALALVIESDEYGIHHIAAAGSYYGTYAAQEIFDQVDLDRLGIVPLKFEHAFFCRRCDQMVSPKTCPHDAGHHVFLSGTRVRELLAAGQRPPAEFSRPEVADVLVRAYAGERSAARAA